MKKSFFTVAVAISLAGTLTFSSCLGSFGITGKLYNFNQNVGGKFVNQVVFWAFCIVPVYEIAVFADVVIFNTIEFWTGSNPIAEGVTKDVKGENGLQYNITSTKDGYKIKCENGQEMNLVYNKETNVWSSIVGENVTRLVKVEGENAIVYVNDKEKNISLTAEGVSAFRNEVSNEMFFAME